MEEEANGDFPTTIEAGGKEEKTDVTRIYVGGLGGTVKADDLKKTFSAPQMGTVTAVEVIRTKGRSFAYLEFLPSSDKGLAKLFSSYNGCMWKGGKLRLEKAKEHYLLRMKREWDEDAELATDSRSHKVDTIESVNSQDKPKKIPDFENMQLRLFFPRLGKVKSLPFKGTGKHKYSFQRVQVPPLPSHFCDCEEHSGALNVAEQQKYSNILTPGKEQSILDHEMDGGGVNEEELNMMNSVMNKLLNRENFSKVVTNSKAKVSAETQNVISSNDDLQAAEDQEHQVSDDDNLIINLVDGSNHNDQENQVSDDDNLIINLVDGSNNNFSSFGNLSAIDSQELVLQELRKSKDRPAKKTDGSQKRTSVPSTEKSKRPNGRKDDDTAIVSDMPERKKRKILPSSKKKGPLDEGEGSGRVSDTPKRKVGSGITGQTNSESKTSQLSGKSPRSQKSVWKNLVSGQDSTTFQISDITASVSDDVTAQPGSDTVSEPLADKKKVEMDSLQTEEAKVSAPNVSHDVEMHPGSDTLSEPPTDKVNLKVDSLQTEELKVPAPSVSADVEMQYGSDTLDDPPTDKKNLKIDALQTEEPKVSAPSVSADVEMQHGSDTLDDPPTDKENLKNILFETNAPKVSAEASSSNANVLTADKAIKGASWLQKSSWTKMVGDSNLSSFSISHILPDVTFGKQESQPHVNIDFSSSTNKKRQNNDREQSNAETNLQIDRNNNEASTSSSGKKQTIVAKPGDTDMDGAFTFVRSSTSMKEWMKTKAAISGSLKKKGNLK